MNIIDELVKDYQNQIVNEDELQDVWMKIGLKSKINYDYYLNILKNNWANSCYFSIGISM